MKKKKEDFEIVDVENTYIFTQKEKAALKNAANSSNVIIEKDILIYLKIIFVIVTIILFLLIYFIINSMIR